MNNNSIFGAHSYLHACLIYLPYSTVLCVSWRATYIWIRVFTLFVYFFFREETIGDDIFSSQWCSILLNLCSKFPRNLFLFTSKYAFVKLIFFSPVLLHSYIYCVLFNHTDTWYDYINWEWNVTSFHLLTFNVYV